MIRQVNLTLLIKVSQDATVFKMICNKIILLMKIQIR